jgi:hypothetical protein
MASAAAVLTVTAGLAIRSWTEGDAAKYAGDALYTTLICTLVGVVAPRVRPLPAAGAALAFSWAVEFSQLSGLPAELSRRSGLARLVLGSTFNAPDLLWYIAGAALGLLLHTSGGSLRRRLGDSPDSRVTGSAPGSSRSGPGEGETQFTGRHDGGRL